ncbi:flagellar filament capping protein FliD [Isoptericola sp. b490]|uniref:flagellar filament capping protein FliD n=1 Tax=Actinotalea lenta TaxID=3064654 RepID=UPI0027131491|nr:flagellar filament capping protein FliD [Isoptericola sp. b490]MDO8122152.1 flagellar filament capping protein FliD [Isoptericola sp. b490]
MAGSTSISGIVSGMDTTSIINQLMQVEAAPQTLLKHKQSTATSLVSALQSLNTKVASLTTAARTAADPDSWKAVSATSSASSVTATTTSNATPSSVTFTVDSVAQSQSSLVQMPASFYTIPPTFQVIRGGQTYNVTAQSTSMADIVAAFNGAGAGVTATTVSANGTTYLQLTGTDTGQANAFTVQSQDSTGTWTDLTTTQIRAASDASITLFAGTPAAQTVTQASNTFSGVLGGVDLTVSAVETNPVTVTVARDDDALTKLASGLVNNLNATLSEIQSRRASKTTTDSTGRTVVTGGLFAGDSTTMLLQQDLMDAGSTSVNGMSLAQIGITLSQDGTFALDSGTFSSALAADPGKVQDLLSGMAGRVQQVGDQASNSGYGSLTLEIQSQQSVVKDLSDQISSWDDRLALRRSTLETTYTAMESALSNLKSQSTWLASQLSSLSASSGASA